MKKLNLVALTIPFFAFTDATFAGQNSGERRILSLTVGANVLGTDDVLIILDRSHANNECNVGPPGMNAMLVEGAADYQILLNALYIALAGDLKVSFAFDGCVDVDFYGFTYSVPSLAGVNLIR